MQSDVPDSPDDASGVSDAALTGVAEVDRVIRGLDRLDALPLEEHVGAFESAHAALRQALDAPHTPMPRPTLSTAPAATSTEQDGA